MPKYTVTTTVTYTGEVEADNREDAEYLGWSYEDVLYYDGVYSIEVEEIDDDSNED